MALRSVLRLTPRHQVVIPQLYRDLGQLGRQVQIDHLEAFWEASWQRYTKITPDAVTVQRLLQERKAPSEAHAAQSAFADCRWLLPQPTRSPEETGAGPLCGPTRLVNDHVAIRTFNLPGMDRRVIGELFQPLGYIRAPETLEFPEKHLLADYYIHPDQRQPKVFISELLLEKVSPELRHWITEGVRPRLSATPATGWDWGRASYFRPLLERAWGPVRYADYRRFYAESEYAAWVAAFGLRLNHFTIFGNELKAFAGIANFNDFLKRRGFLLSSAGGEIKGSAASLLEQSSTVARRVPVRFQEGLFLVPGGYYEFAWRHPLPPRSEGEREKGEDSVGCERSQRQSASADCDGEELFQGFIPESANRIFESTSLASGIQK